MGPLIRYSRNLEKKTLSKKYWRVQLVRMKVQAHRSLEPPQEYNAFDESRFIMTFLAFLGITEIYSLRLNVEGKAGKEIPESSRWELLEKFLANNFALSYVKNFRSELLDWGSIAYLPLLRALLTICQKFRVSRT